jgi:hypothetical protein
LPKARTANSRKGQLGDDVRGGATDFAEERLDPDMKKDRYGRDRHDLSSYKEGPGDGRPAPQRRKEMFISFTLQVMKKWSLTVTIFF